MYISIRWLVLVEFRASSLSVVNGEDPDRGARFRFAPCLRLFTPLNLLLVPGGGFTTSPHHAQHPRHSRYQSTPRLPRQRNCAPGVPLRRPQRNSVAPSPPSCPASAEHIRAVHAPHYCEEPLHSNREGSGYHLGVWFVQGT